MWKENTSEFATQQIDGRKIIPKKKIEKIDKTEKNICKSKKIHPNLFVLSACIIFICAFRLNPVGDRLLSNRS